MSQEVYISLRTMLRKARYDQVLSHDIYNMWSDGPTRRSGHLALTKPKTDPRNNTTLQVTSWARPLFSLVRFSVGPHSFPLCTFPQAPAHAGTCDVKQWVAGHAQNPCCRCHFSSHPG
jgi:hypothetical protein